MASRRASRRSGSTALSPSRGRRLGLGIAVLPDYLAKDDPGLINLLEDVEMPVFDVYFVYPEDLKDTKRVNAFRDFLVAKSREWAF